LRCYLLPKDKKERLLTSGAGIHLQLIRGMLDKDNLRILGAEK